MKMARKFMSLALSALLVLTLVACDISNGASTSTSSTASTTTIESNTSEASTENTSSEVSAESSTSGIETEDVKLTISVRENIRVENYNTNDMKKQIEDALGVSLEFMVLPSEDYETKINLMVVGGEELPDMIFSPTRDSVNFWAQEGALLPLNDYYNDPEMAKNIKLASDTEGIDVPTYMTWPDGNIYGLPAFGPSPNGEVWRKLWVYEPWLEELDRKSVV